MCCVLCERIQFLCDVRKQSPRVGLANKENNSAPINNTVPGSTVAIKMLNRKKSRRVGLANKENITRYARLSSTSSNC